MAKACREIELAVRLGDQGGALSKVLAIVAAQGVNVLAYCCYSDRDDSVVLLVTDHPYRAQSAIEAAGFLCRANPVVLVGSADRVGAAAELGAHLATAGIDILYSYASSNRQENFCAVFKTRDDERAIRVLTEGFQTREAA